MRGSPALRLCGSAMTSAQTRCGAPPKLAPKLAPDGSHPWAHTRGQHAGAPSQGSSKGVIAGWAPDQGECIYAPPPPSLLAAAPSPQRSRAAEHHHPRVLDPTRLLATDDCCIPPSLPIPPSRTATPTMRLAFNSPDLANASLINTVTHKPAYEILSSPPNSAERFTTLRHAAPEGKERWEGKFIGSIEWPPQGGLEEEREREREGEEERGREGERTGEKREEGWIVWAKPEAPKRELAALLRPAEAKGKQYALFPSLCRRMLIHPPSARIFTGYMRADYVWTFKSFVLPHKPPLLQLTPANSPDPIVTFHPATRLSRCDSGSHSHIHHSNSHSSSRGARRSFSLSRSPSKPRAPARPLSREDLAPEEPDSPHGYLDISPRAVEMLDLVVLTFLAMALAPNSSLHAQPGRSLSLSGRLSLRSPPGSSGRHSGLGSAPISSGEATGSVPSTPEDEDEVPSPDDAVVSPVPMRSPGRKGWKDLFGFKTPSPAIIANGFDAGMDKIRRFSFPAVGRPKIKVHSGNYEADGWGRVDEGSA
ncbi:hypothetical protein CALCODRAFT_119990 [Calocera cornea HHB12733]|uniref:Uncharacterized protein n=1 Tax=Calocera cornea HHB12733 TaxID=1353952 RepID=A0A165IEM2_9BASI|nr:hypothetical protein CALCODRAFT_119990 [Calocera cornea HHB12733]